MTQSTPSIVFTLIVLAGCSTSFAVDTSPSNSPDSSDAMDATDATQASDAGLASDTAQSDRPANDAGTDAALPPDAGPPPASMAACLEDGGELHIVDTLDNNDTREHGAILAFAVSDARHIAVSTADATLKFWTLDGFQAETRGETGLAQLSYGPEVIATTVALDFWDDVAVAGDNQGLIAGWTGEGMQSVLGGTTPGTAIVAVAVDSEAGFLAQADAEGTLLVRPLPGFEGDTAQIEGVDAADLSWANGVLFVATPRGVQARDASLTLIADVQTGNPQRFVHAEGDVVVSGSAGGLMRAFDASLEALNNDLLSFSPLHSVTSVGEHPVGLFGGPGPYLEVQIAGASAPLNTSLTFEPLAGDPRVPVQVVADPQGELLFVAFEDGLIELVGCARRFFRN